MIHHTKIYPIALLTDFESFLDNDNFNYETTLNETTKEESIYFNIIIELENLDEYNKIIKYENHIDEQFMFWVNDNIETIYKGYCVLYIKMDDINYMIKTSNFKIDKTIFEYQILKYKNIESILKNYNVIKAINKNKKNDQPKEKFIYRIDFHFKKKSKLKISNKNIKIKSKKLNKFSINLHHNI